MKSHRVSGKGHRRHAGLSVHGVFVCRSTSPPMQHSLCLTTLPMPHTRSPGVFMYLGGEILVLFPLGFTSKQQSCGSCSRRIITSSPTGPILPHRLLNRQQAVGSCREKQKQCEAESQPTCSGFIKWGSSFAKLLFFHSETSGPSSEWFLQAFLYSLLWRRSITNQSWHLHAQVIPRCTEVWIYRVEAEQKQWYIYFLSSPVHLHLSPACHSCRSIE